MKWTVCFTRYAFADMRFTCGQKKRPWVFVFKQKLRFICNNESEVELSYIRFVFLLTQLFNWGLPLLTNDWSKAIDINDQIIICPIFFLAFQKTLMAIKVVVI